VISDVARLLRTAFDRRVHRLGITRAQWLVLTRLHRHPGASQSALADLSAREGTQLRALLGRVKKNLLAVVGGGAANGAVYAQPAPRRAHRHNGSVAP